MGGRVGMEIRHYKFNRITLDSEKCFGKPCIRGLRMPVALGYAAWALQERVVPLEEIAVK